MWTEAFEKNVRKGRKKSVDKCKRLKQKDENETEILGMQRKSNASVRKRKKRRKEM